MKLLLLIFSTLCFFTVTNSWAATKQSAQNGNWSTGSTWVGGSVPSSSDNIIVQHTLTSTSGLTFSNQTINITGSLTINGNLILTNNAVLTVTGGSLSVTETFEIAEGAKIVLNGGTVSVDKDAFTNGAAGGFFDIQAGTMTIKLNTRITTVNSSFNNKGTFKSGSLTLDGNGTSITNSGTVDITGITTINTVFANTGSFTTSTNLLVNYAGKMTTTNPGKVTVGANMLVENGGVYTMNSGVTQINGNLTVNTGSKYTMTTGSTNVGGNMALDSGGAFVMDGTTTVAGSFTNNNSTATIGANSSSSTLYANQSNTAANGMNNNRDINGKGWLSWKGNFVNYIGYGGKIYTVPGPVINGPSIPSTNPFSLSGFNSGSLPIRLIAFEAAQQNNQCILSWTTTQEENFDYFVVEKSADAKNFRGVATIKGQGNSNRQVNYQFTDTENTYGISYYRLKSVDLDSSSEYSKIVSVENKVTGVQLYPNPVENQQLNVLVPGDGASNSIKLFNKMGRLVWQASLQPGLNALQLDSQVKPDIYNAVISTGHTVYRSKIIVK